MEDKKLENKLEDEQLEEVSGGAHARRIKKGPKDAVKPVFTVGKSAVEEAGENNRRIRKIPEA